VIKDMDELLRVSQPLIDLLRNNYNPHCRIVVEFDGVKIVEDTCRVPLKGVPTPKSEHM
jgi:hypothetical protein